MVDMNKVEKVAIFGSALVEEQDPLYQQVFQTSKLLAQSGFVVAQGGGAGLMCAAGKGAKAGGGQTIGVTFYPTETDGVTSGSFEGRDKNNPLDREIVTKSLVERTLTLMEQGDVYVVYKGGTGTVAEFGMAWGLAKVHFGHHKPLILYGSWWHTIMETFAENMYISDTALKVYTIVDTPEEVLEAVRQVAVSN